jgi:hypothetical protein
MGEVVELATPRRALLALAAMPADERPEAWPTERMVRGAFIAAALITERLDALPADCNGPLAAWSVLPKDLRALVQQRNPAMAAFCASGGC